MFYTLIELIKETNPDNLKRALIEFVAGYTEIEKDVAFFRQEIENNLFLGRDEPIVKLLNSFAEDEITKIDGKIEIFEEFEAQLENGMYEPIPVTENVINVMLLDYEKRLNESLSETLKMYYGIKIDTLKELKSYL